MTCTVKVGITKSSVPAWIFFFWGNDQSLSENSAPGCKSHQFVSVPRFREAMYSPLELSSTGFLFPWDSPVVDMGFTEISRSQVGGAWLGTEQKYFCDLAAMTRKWLCISSFQDWTGAGLNRSIQGLIDHVDSGQWTLEAYPQNSCLNSLRQLYSCLGQWHLLGPMVLPCIVPSPTTSYCNQLDLRGSKRSLSPCITRGTGAPLHCSIWCFVTIRRARN